MVLILDGDSNRANVWRENVNYTINRSNYRYLPTLLLSYHLIQVPYCNVCWGGGGKGKWGSSVCSTCIYLHCLQMWHCATVDAVGWYIQNRGVVLEMHCICNGTHRLLLLLSFSLGLTDLVGRKPCGRQLGRNSKHEYLRENPVKHEENKYCAWNKDNTLILILDGFSD